MKHLLATLVLLLSGTAAAELIQSSTGRTNLVELYTSEGCSSCPPADRWLSGLVDHPELWNGLVPIAFHVDYWDYIGWQDRFADPAHSERQRRYAREKGLVTVYTPGVLSNGKEWRNFAWRPPASGGAPEVGILTARLAPDQVIAVFEPVEQPATRTLVLHSALLGFGLTTRVRSGENAGRELRHDFVVLQHEESTMHRDGDVYRTTTALPVSDTPAERYALAVWVAPPDSQAPIQSAGGWLGNRLAQD